MALFSLVVLGLLCLQPDGMDKGANAPIAVQQPAMPVPTPQIRQDPIPQYEPPKEFVHHLEQQQPQFQQQPRMDSQPPAEFGRTPSRLRLGQDGAMPEMDHLQRTDKAGGPGGAAYSIVDNQRRPVRGFRWKMSTWFKEPTLAELTPVYEAREAPTSELEAEPFLVMAKEGYAVGGINVIADKFVRGVQVIFMKLDGDRLNPEDKYSSDWIGAETSESTATLTNDGKMVIGVFGGKGAVMDSIGLILDDK